MDKCHLCEGSYTCSENGVSILCLGSVISSHSDIAHAEALLFASFFTSPFLFHLYTIVFILCIDWEILFCILYIFYFVCTFVFVLGLLMFFNCFQDE